MLAEARSNAGKEWGLDAKAALQTMKDMPERHRGDAVSSSLCALSASVAEAIGEGIPCTR